MIKIQPRPSPSAREKEKLEIRKLQTDILFAKLTFTMQIINSVSILALGILILLYFQRPQIEQMEAARLAAEKQQIALALERANAVENSQQRAAQFTMLKSLFPQYREIVGAAEDTRNLMDIRTVPVQDKDMCAEALANITKLENGRERLEAELAAEVEGVRSGSIGSGKAGLGPIAKGIQQQLADLRTKIDTAKAQASQCYAK
jgi:hypothetical protein